jgi:uncharacterized Zn-binding protein involved in type VI secretion
MTLKLLATSGDTEIQKDAHIPPAGGGEYTIPSTLQNFVFVNGRLIILGGQEFSAHGTARVVASSKLLFVNGLAVARHGDNIDHHHDNGGVIVGNQSFAYSD